MQAGSGTESLAKVVTGEVKMQGLDLKVAWVQGDEVLDVVNRLMKEGHKFENICFGRGSGGLGLRSGRRIVSFRPV